MIRLTAESSAFLNGEGWRAYMDYIGQEIFYPEYNSEIKNMVLSSAKCILLAYFKFKNR
jgi:hypothetical protein